MDLRDLTPEVRAHMLAEFEADGASVSDYYGKRLTPAGLQDFPALLIAAITTGSEATLETELGLHDRLRTMETVVKRNVEHEQQVPKSAARVMAEGEFNRYYIRAVCMRAIELGKEEVIVYRARESTVPSPDSQRKLGCELNAKALLSDLRKHVGDKTTMGVPEVGGGLSVHL